MNYCQHLAKADRSRLLFLDKNKEKWRIPLFSTADFCKVAMFWLLTIRSIPPAIWQKADRRILEILLLTKKEIEKESQKWEVLLRPAKTARNDVIDLGNNCEARF